MVYMIEKITELCVKLNLPTETRINSKTYGEKVLLLDFPDLITASNWRGFCIQSTNKKSKGQNPSLYPVVWKYENGKTIVRQVHKVLGIGCPIGHVIDHLNGNTFDNRRCNLEVITRAENTRRAQLKKEKNYGI